MPKRVILYLTPKERLLLERQDAALYKQCEITDEDHAISDSTTHRSLRAELFAPRHPVLQRLTAVLARENATEFEVHALLADADFSNVAVEDMLEVAFLLGPVGMSSLIFEMLAGLSSPETLDMIAELTELRRHLLFAQDDAASFPSSL